jgi:fructose-1-phosphate kinase PfkB-like protein
MTNPPRIATVSLNPAIDQTALVPNFTAGSVNRVEREQSDAGGKGVNVASFLAHFGFPVVVTGLLGDANLEPFVRLFAEKGIIDSFVRVPGLTRVNVKIVDEVQDRVTDINFPGLRVAEDCRATRQTDPLAT